MTHLARSLSLLSLLALTACSTTAPGPATKSTVGGIEMWKNGNPDRPYHTIGKVQKQGPDQSATFAQEEQLIARDATDRGADGFIIENEVMVTSRIDPLSGRPVLAPKVEADLFKY